MNKLVGILAFCSLQLAGVQAAQARVSVVTTVPNLAALTREVGGKHVEVSSLSLHTQDPHFVDARPSLALRLNRADLLIVVGLQLETGWLPKLQVGARNPAVQVGGRGYLDCSRFAQLRQVPTTRVDRSMGDIHPAGNPHYLYDPRQALRCAQGISEKLVELDPEHETDYRANMQTFASRLLAKIADWQRRMLRHRGAAVLTYHQSWVYLVGWLGLDEVAHLEPKPGVPPTPGHVVHVIKLAKRKGVKVLFQESYYPSKTGRLIASKVKAQLVLFQGGTNLAGGQSYIGFIDGVIAALDRGLRG